MNRFKLILTALLTTGTVCLSACTDESASKADPADDPTTQGDPCDNPCTENAKECRDNAVWACQKKDDAECPAWQKIETCSDGSVCDTASHTCKADCSVTCSPEAAKRCEKDVLLECVTDENGCGAWNVVEACEGICNEQTLQCEMPQCEWGKYFDKESKECKLVCGDNCEPFSIVFIPDPQKYTRPLGEGKIFKQELTWIKENYKDPEWNIKAVMHLGDMTDSNREEAWNVVKKAYDDTLAKIDLPFLVAAGNHDYLVCNTPEHDSCPYFGKDKTMISSEGGFNDDYFNEVKKKWTYAKFGGFYDTGNSYLTMEVSGIKFLLMSLEYVPNKNVLCWADSIISQYPDHKVILETHGYLSANADIVARDSDNRYSRGYYEGESSPGLPTGASGLEIYNELVARHNNIILVASGHITSNIFRMNKGHDDNHWFNEMVIDYEGENPFEKKCGGTWEHGGSGGGWIRVLTFDPKSLTIQAHTLSACDPKYCKDENCLCENNKDYFHEKPQFYCNPASQHVAYPNDPEWSPEQPLSTDYFTKKDIDLYDATCLSRTKIGNPQNNHFYKEGEYSIDPANTVCHTFAVKYDFVSPIEYKLTDKNVGFTHQYINEISNGEQETPSVAMNRETRDFVAVWTDEAYDNDEKTAKDTDGDGNNDIRARVSCKTTCQINHQITVNTTTKGNQHDPDVAMNPTSDFVVVWTSDEDNSVYMRKFGQDGSEIVKETKVNTSGKADKAAVAMADDGSYVVTWQHGEDIGDIYMRGFDASGKEMFAQTNVSTTPLINTDKFKGKRNLPDVAMDKNGDFVITWEEGNYDNGSYNVLARGFKKDGSERIKEFVANKEKGYDQLKPSIGMTSDGLFTIAWEDNSENKDIFRIRMRGFNKDGSERVPEDYVSKQGNEASNPSICMSNNGDTYFSWEEIDHNQSRKDKDNKDSIHDIFIRNLSSSKKFTDEYSITPVFWGIQDQPAITCADKGGHIVLWRDRNHKKEIREVLKHQIMGKGF